jgi:hypothetical protein
MRYEKPFWLFSLGGMMTTAAQQNYITAPLHEFRWRKTQRRLVSDKWYMSLADKILIQGKGMNVMFEFHMTGHDPHTKTHKPARVYKPAPDTPKNLQDIILYVHI